MSPGHGDLSAAPERDLGPKQTLLKGFKLPSRVEHPGTEAAKGEPGPVPVTFRHLGHLEVLGKGKTKRGHQKGPHEPQRWGRSGVTMAGGHGARIGARCSRALVPRVLGPHR